MAEPDGPGRLCQRRDLSPSLTRALGALRAGPDDSARLARVSCALGALLDQPYEPTSRIVRRAELRGRESALRTWLAGGLALLAPVVWLARGGWPLASEPPPLSAASVGRPVPAVSAPEPGATEPLGEGTLPLTEAGSPVSARLPAGALELAARRSDGKSRARQLARSSPKERRGPGHERASERDALPLRAADAREETLDQSQPAAADLEVPVTAPEPVHASAEEPPAPRAEPAPRAPAAESSSSESELLLNARAALRTDPERALRLVTEHEARFAGGSLVPEREVLAIEVLRRLGRTVDAKARLARFAASYPHSFYLEGLQR